MNTAYFERPADDSIFALECAIQEYEIATREFEFMMEMVEEQENLNRARAELKCYAESGSVSDLIYLYQEASDGSDEKKGGLIGGMFKKIGEFFSDILSTIQNFLTGAKDKATDTVVNVKEDVYAKIAEMEAALKKFQEESQKSSSLVDSIMPALKKAGIVVGTGAAIAGTAIGVKAAVDHFGGEKDGDAGDASGSPARIEDKGDKVLGLPGPVQTTLDSIETTTDNIKKIAEDTKENMDKKSSSKEKAMSLADIYTLVGKAKKNIEEFDKLRAKSAENAEKMQKAKCPGKAIRNQLENAQAYAKMITMENEVIKHLMEQASDASEGARKVAERLGQARVERSGYKGDTSKYSLNQIKKEMRQKSKDAKDQARFRNAKEFAEDDIDGDPTFESGLADLLELIDSL